MRAGDDVAVNADAAAAAGGAAADAVAADEQLLK